jgi:hypothetical protein
MTIPIVRRGVRSNWAARRYGKELHRNGLNRERT